MLVGSCRVSNCSSLHGSDLCKCIGLESIQVKTNKCAGGLGNNVLVTNTAWEIRK